jgi:arylsulfatase A-like enzyme
VAIDWLRKGAAAGGEPFFGWVSFADPHHPMDPPARWFDMYDPADVAEMMPEHRDGELDSKPPVHALWSRGARGGPLEWANPGGASLTQAQLARMIAAYYGMVSQLDHNIGRILDTLDELGIADDTMVVMTTDHGEMLGDHRIIFKGPVHYEGLLRVPLIVRGPGIAAGAVVDDPVGTIDLAPTMLRAAGLDVPEHMEGEPLFDADNAPTRREHVLTEDDFDAVLRVPLRTITTDRYKLTTYLDAPGQGELYDLVQDPGEFVNLWDDQASASLRSDLAATLADLTVRVDETDALPSVGLVA